MDDYVFGMDRLWKGGYYQGDPLDPHGENGYGEASFIDGESVLHRTYRICIEPYVNQDTVALEIGAGRGTFSKPIAMLGAKELWVLEVASAEFNHFYEHMGDLLHSTNVIYVQTNGKSVNALMDCHYDFCFTFGCLCHLPFEAIENYARQLYPKMLPGAHLFWMYGSREKWAVGMPSRPFPDFGIGEENTGKWFDNGGDVIPEMLESVGYVVIDKDVDVVRRDPVIHFVKPK